MRHGRAEHGGGADRDRELTAHGRAQGRAVGRHLAAHRLCPDRVLVSSAVRTCRTWEAVNAQLPPAPRDVRYEDGLYGADDIDALALLRDVPDTAHTVMLIGHDPGISLLARLLSGDGSDPAGLAQVRAGLPTGTVCVLEAPTSPWRTLAAGSLLLRTVVRG